MPNGQTSIETQSGYIMWLTQYLAGAGLEAEQVKAIMDAEYTRMNAGMPPDASPYYRDVYEFYVNYQKTITPEPTIGGYEVEAQGGYNFAVVRDDAGNIIDIRSLGQAEPEGLSAWQQSQINRWQQEFEWQQEQTRIQQQQAMMPYGQMTAYQQAQMGLQQQAYAAETAAMPPSGWIEQWYRMQGRQPDYQPSPKPKGMTEKEYATRFRETMGKARQAIEGWERGQSLPSDMPLPGNWVYLEAGAPLPPRTVTQTIEEPGIIPIPYGVGGFAKPGVGYLPDYAPRESEIGYQMVGWQPPREKKKAAVRRPTTPPAPPGLAQFVPSQVAGQPITRAPTATPSGQMWQATPWSTQEMLRGYTGWAGYRPMEDIMQHMWAMQPATPAGAGRQRWQPARQWA